LPKANQINNIASMNQPKPPLPRVQRSRARTMRKELTPAELRLWHQLRAHRLMGLGFRRQHPVGPFITDFACIESKVIVELDGSQHGLDDMAVADARRTDWLQEQGWLVLRFWNDDVLNALDDVCQNIWIVCDGRRGRH
jgi:very-short-patch-repair endonuclease